MIMNTKTAAIAASLIISVFFIAQPVLAEGDIEAGKVLAYTCLGCHGIEGYRNAYPSYRVPKLGGQKAAYLVIALNGYRSGMREHPTMQAHASSLSDKDIDDVSSYLATLGTDTVAGGGSKDVGFEKAQGCVACHGNNGVSVNAIWPTLAGQHEEYLEVALKSYKNGRRKDAVMSAQATLIADEDIAALAKYFAGLEGLETTKLE